MGVATVALEGGFSAHPGRGGWASSVVHLRRQLLLLLFLHFC